MKSILVVDDVAVNLKCVEEILKDKYEVTAVKSGREALATLKQIHPDLILLDINMPEMDGFEVFERIKADSYTADIPVAFITAETNKEVEIKSMAMGAVGFIRKPVDQELLISKVAQILELYHHDADRPQEVKEDSVSFETSQKNLKEIIAKADSGQIEGYFILLNMDNFRQINELFGVVTGDGILNKTLTVLTEEVAEAGSLCYIGGDAFLLFLGGRLQKDYVRTVIRRIIAVVEFEVNESLPEEYHLPVSLSAGIAQKPQDGNSFRALYERADKALYHVKQDGKRSYHFYNSEDEEAKDISEEKDIINLLQLQRLFRSRENALTSGTENLQKAYQMALRCWGSKTQIQLILFSVAGDWELSVEPMLEEKLAKVVVSSLRKGDASVKCGKLQYLVMLQNASCENGDMAARRVKKKFEESIEDSVALLTYEMKSILPVD